jgi:phosphoenolpyruvate-protein kinase (PTS system EI component)
MSESFITSNYEKKALPHEDNPFLGMRGIRLSFKYEDMFKRQLEAIYLTAIWQKEATGSTGRHIMFPMIARMAGWRKARDIAESIRLQLNAPKLPLGLMIDVPEAVMELYQSNDDLL